MARDDHQPIMEAPERPHRSIEELEDACARTIAIVMAFGERGEIDVRPAIDAARRARMPGVFVLADDAHLEAAMRAVRETDRNGKSIAVEVVGYDQAAALPLTREAADFELCELPYGLIKTAHAIASQVLDGYESVIILDAAMESVTFQHLYELCVDMRAHPGTEVVASWIQWLRRPPYLFSRDFLERLDEAPYANRRIDGTRPVAHIALRDHVFGEEKLAAPGEPPARVTRFLDACTMGALEALQVAKYANEHPDAELHSPNQAASLMGPIEPEPLNSADSLLVRTAQGVLSLVDALSEDEAAELAWADGFGLRNKADFPLLNDRKHGGRLVYLDSAATTQRLDVALQAQRDYDMHENANVYRGAYALSAQSTFTFNDARKHLEDFIGAEHRSTVFTMNTSGAISLVAQAWGEHNIGEGDLIVCCLADHHSNTLPFAMLAERKGAEVVYVPFDEDGRLDRAAYDEAMVEGPKLVCLAHVGNVFGIEAPVAELARAAHAAGARVLVDAAQSFPHMKIDVKELGADWVALSAHKAYGPMGIGALWISDEAFAEMDPLVGGGGVVSHVSTESYYLRPKALQYEPGTPPVSQAVGWAAAIGHMEAIGMDDIARHGAILTRYAVHGLQQIDGVNVVGDHSRADGQTGLVSFTVRSVTPAALARFLGSMGVAIRSGGHCALPLHATLGMIGTGRISIGIHTTRDDIDAALVAVALCRQAYEG